MASEDLGTLQIGIGADLTQLDAALKEASTRVQEFKVPVRKITFDVVPPSDAALTTIARKVNRTLELARNTKVELTPTLTLKNVKIQDFRDEVQRKMDGTKPVGIKLTASIDGEELRAQILKEIGVTDIPLTWHWENGPPPGPGAGGGGGGGAPAGRGPVPTTGGGGAAQAGSRAAPTRTVAVARPTRSVPATAKVGAAAAVPVVAEAPAERLPYLTPGTFREIPQEGATGFRSLPVAESQRAARPLPPRPEGTFRRVITREQAGPQDPESLIATAVGKLQDGNADGLTDLLKLGIVLTPGEIGEFGTKRGSKLGKAIKNKPEIKQQILAALKANDQGGNEPTGARPAFSGAALGLAKETGIDVESRQLNNLLRGLMSQTRGTRQTEAYRSDPRVVALKAQIRAEGGGEKGFIAAVAPELEGALTLVKSGRSVEAREAGVEVLKGIYGADPKLGRRLFDAVSPNPINAKAGDRGRGAVPGGLKRERALLTQYDREGNYQEPNPRFEALASTIRAIFGEATAGEVPRLDVAEKAGRKLDVLARSTKPEGTVELGDAYQKAVSRRRSQELTTQKLVERGLPRVRTVPEGTPPSFLQALPGRKRKEGEFGYDFDVADRLFRLRQASEKGPIDPKELIQLMKLKGYAGGGPILKPGGLMARLAQKGIPIPENAVMVGEKGPELFVPKAHGHIIDNKAQNIPEWLRRGQMGQNKTKDITGYAEGGEIRSVDQPDYGTPPAESPFREIKIPRRRIKPPRPVVIARRGAEVSSVDEPDYGTPPIVVPAPKPVIVPVAPRAAAPIAVAASAPTPVVASVPAATRREFAGRFAAEPQSGLGAPYRKFREPFPGERQTIAAGGLSPTGGVQRVFVVNWPPAFARGAAASTPAQGQAAGAVDVEKLTRTLLARFSTELSAAQSAAEPKIGPLIRATRRAAPQETERETPVGPVSSGVRYRARVQARSEAEDRAQRITAARAETSERLQFAPVRSLSVSVGQIFANLFGGRGDILTKSREANRLADHARVLDTEAQTAQKSLIELEDKRNRATGQTRKTYAALVKEQKQTYAEASAGAEAATKAAEEAAHAVVDTTSAFRSLAAGTSGVVVGTLGFGAALAIGQAGLQGISAVIGPVVERITGFTATSATLTSQLAEQTQTAGGDAKSIVQLASAHAGLADATTSTIGPLLEQRTATEEGNKNLQSGLDLVHTYEASRRAGGAQGLFATTGGFLGTSIGGTASTQELIRKELTSPDTQLSFGQPEQRARALAAQAAGQTTFTQKTGILSGLGIGSDVTFNVADVLKETGAAAQVLTDRMGFFNDELKKGGSSLHFMQAASEDVANTFASAADRAGATELGAAARSPNRVILVDENNQPVTNAGAIQGSLQDINLGAQTPDAATLIRQLENRILPAQFAAFQEEGKLQLQQISAQQGLAQINQPPTPFGAGFEQVTQGPTGATPIGARPTTGFGPTAPGVDPQATASFNQYRSIAQSAIDAVVAKANEGKQALRDLGVPESTISELEILGKQAQGIELGVANEQAALQAAQYNRQLFIMRRNLADAAALTGRQADAQGILGKLQRENFELGKQQNALQIQSQELSIGLSQRQINFQRALAGFTAPGETAEERAARIAEAKIEADYAQRQLNIQKQLLGLGKRQFTVGVQIFDVTAQRQLADLQVALADLQTSHRVQLDTAAAQQALAAIRARQAQINAEVGVGIEKAVKIASLKISTALDIAQKSGEAFGQILITVGTSFARALNIALGPLINYPGGQGTPSTQPGQAGHTPGGAASGIVGDTLGPTDLTVGEAGRETVAVIRNPKKVAIQSLAGVAPAPAGAGTMVVIDVHGNTIGDEGAADALVQKIARAVEQTINRKSSLLGLRAP